MIESLTGFGKSTLQLTDRQIVIEIRALNSKQLDLQMKLSSLYREKEIELRHFISSLLYRGKIEFIIHTEWSANNCAQKINLEVVEDYIEQLKTLVPNLNPQDYLPTVMRLPDVISYQKQALEQTHWQQLLFSVKQAINQLILHRKTEGATLEKELKTRVYSISEKINILPDLAQQRMEIVNTRLRKLLAQNAVDVDENRFEQELIYYLEKMDITEEEIRLKNHCDYFLQTLDQEKNQGKKLGFIAQEMGREINTIGSKSNYAQMQKVVVLMKDELEKIKEQLFNVL